MAIAEQQITFCASVDVTQSHAEMNMELDIMPIIVRIMIGVFTMIYSNCSSRSCTIRGL